MKGRSTGEREVERVRIPLGLAAIAVWLVAQVLTVFTFPLKDVVVASLMALAYSTLALAHMLGYSMGIVLRIAPNAKGAELRRLLAKDLRVGIKTGLSLMINIAPMPFTIHVVEIATKVQIPSGQFRILLPLITAVLMLMVACVVLPEREDLEKPPRGFVDAIVRWLYDHVFLGKYIRVKLRIDPHDMLLVALPVIGGALIDIPIAIAFAYAIYPHLAPPLTLPVKLALVMIAVILYAILQGLYLIGKRRVRSEKVREEYDKILFTYAMTATPLIILLLWGEGIITITPSKELLATLAVFALLYILGYFAAINYLRYVGLITEKLPTTNKENQKHNAWA